MIGRRVTGQTRMGYNSAVACLERPWALCTSEAKATNTEWKQCAIMLASGKRILEVAANHDSPRASQIDDLLPSLDAPVEDDASC